MNYLGRNTWVNYDCYLPNHQIHGETTLDIGETPVFCCSSGNMCWRGPTFTPPPGTYGSSAPAPATELHIIFMCIDIIDTMLAKNVKKWWPNSLMQLTRKGGWINIRIILQNYESWHLWNPFRTDKRGILTALMDWYPTAGLREFLWCQGLLEAKPFSSPVSSATRPRWMAKVRALELQW